MASSERTAQQEANLKLVSDGLNDWIAGHQEATIATFTDDVEVFVPAELGNAGTYKGIEQFRKWFSEWDDAWSEFEMAVEEIEPAGDRHVIAMIRSRGVGAGSGVEVGNLLAWVLGIRDGKMEFLSLQPDREHAEALVRERESASAD